MKIDDLDADPFAAIYARLDALETADPLGNAAVTRGSTRFFGNESLKVIGSQLVSGWLIVTGTLKVVGALILEGITTITGALTATGTTNLNGPTTQNGPLAVNGDTTQNGNVTVNSPGKIVVAGSAPMTMGITSAGTPGVQIGSSMLTSAGGTMVLASGSSTVGVSATTVTMVFAGNSVNVTSTGTRVVGALFAALPARAVAGVAAGFVRYDPVTGELFRTS